MASASPIEFPSANWSVPLTLSAMDLGMSFGWTVSFAAEFCGVPDFPTAERVMPHRMRRVATRKRLILASGIQKEDTSALEGSRTCGLSGRLFDSPPTDVPAISKRTETVKFAVQKRSMRSMTYEHAILRAKQKFPHF